MKAIVSTKGQVVIPHDVREALGIHPGDIVNIRTSQHQIILEKEAAVAKPKLKLIKGKMPILKMPRNAEPLTAAMVKEIAQI